MFIGTLDSIDDLHEQFTELLEDLIHDLPSSQEDSSTDRSEGPGAQRTLFLNGECGSLRSEVGRLQSVLCWRGKMLVTLDGIRAGQVRQAILIGWRFDELTLTSTRRRIQPLLAEPAVRYTSQTHGS